MYRKFPQAPSDLYRYPLDAIDDGYNRQNYGRITFRACPRYEAD